MEAAVDIVPAALLVGLAIAAGLHSTRGGPVPRHIRWRYPVVACAAAVLWWLGGLSASIAPFHRPLLVYAVLTLPDGRVRSRAAIAAVAVAAGEAIVGRLIGGPGGPTVLAAALVWAAVDGWGTAPRRLRGPIELATLLVAGGCALVAIAHVVGRTGTHSVGVERAYATVVSLAVLALVVAALAGRDGRAGSADTADAVVELADAADDPLTAGDIEFSDDPVVVAGWQTASRLLAEHRRLDAELAARVEATRAARRLLVEVADTEAAAIDRMLTARAVPTITALTEVIGELAGRPDDVGGYATRMLGELDELTDELDRLVHGLPPSRLADTGLAVALADLAARTPAVTLGRVPAERFALSTEATVWYVCAEAVANAVKHADAARIAIDVDVTSDDRVVVVVADDGPGGARPEPGGGLDGLADRVEAIGGRLDVESPAAGGTRLTAEVPVG